jgi:glycolate oxidase FAD binding subunit
LTPDPHAATRPASAAAAGEAVRAAKLIGVAVLPRGGGTHWHLGNPPNRGTTLDLRGLDRVIDYPARDLTVTVQAGLTLASLAKTLAAEGQELPIDVPDPATATVGGALAANANGPRRGSRGTWRDAVIGVSFLTDGGVEVKAGGRVVKNVAGYDLMKLHVGALGTLGVVTQVTLKLQPKAEGRAFVAFGLNAAAVGPALDRLHASQARPPILELLNAAAARSLGVPVPANLPWVVFAGFEEKHVTLDHQLKTLRDELAGGPARDLAESRGPDADAILAALTQSLADPAEGVRFRASVLPSRLAALALEADATGAAVHTHAALGVLYGHLPADAPRDEVAAHLSRLSPAPAGSLVVRRCPEAWRGVLPGYGPTGPDAKLMRAVKRALDPADLFNPGRLFRD